MKKEQEFVACAERLKALADPDRLRILQCLFTGPLNVGQIAEKLNEEIVNVSHHLAVMRRAKVLLATKRGRFVEYQIHPEVSLERLQPKAIQRIDFGCCRVDIKQ
jgi:ArsR family transcriptional regulator